ncbi:MAG: CorA family divalent cation transporter, partial [Candidatus Micrarchaeota archaeon]
LSLIMFKKALHNYGAKYDRIHAEISALEESFDPEKIGEVSNRLRKLIDKVDDFMNVLIGVEERRVREVNTSYAGYDYHVLTATATHLLDRCRNTSNRVKDLRSEYEMKSSQELNKRIEYMTNVMKKLTALMLILLIPNIIASHYGMNFKYMPELGEPWGYPLTIVVSVVFVVGAVILFKKKNWL